MRINFDNAKKLYRQKLLPMLEGELGVIAQDVKEGKVDTARAQLFRNNDRLLKTLLLSALAPEVEALHALTPIRLAALNHGTVRSPIPGQEGAIVLQRCRNWAAQVGEIKVSDDGLTPTISLHIMGVDTDGILANAQSFDSYGNRIQKIRALLYEQLGLDPVVELKRALKEAQSAALELLTSLVEVAPPLPPAVHPPGVQPPAPQAETTGSRRAIDEQSAATLFETIRRAMASDPRLVLDFEWHLYRQDGQSR
jgi:hypothetical protein